MQDADILNELKRINGLRSSGDFNNSLPKIDTPIPDDIKISCPLKGGRDRLAGKCCKQCAAFDSIVQKSYSTEPMEWDKQYAIRCAYPLERTVTRLVD